MNRSEGAKKVGPPQKNNLDPLLILMIDIVSLSRVAFNQPFIDFLM